MGYSYAQNGEDLVLAMLLPSQTGMYVDVGANMPDGDSVTKLFYEKGWRGINIEPIPSLHRKLAKGRPEDINLNVGIADKPGTLTFREYKGRYHGWSTFSSDIKSLASRKARPYKDYSVTIRTLRDIFKEYDVTDIDFLKVDVEGLEYEVLKSNDWTKWKPKIVIVENTPGKWQTFILQKGYKEVFFDGLNRYFAHEDTGVELPMRNYNAIIDEFYEVRRQAAQEKRKAALRRANLKQRQIMASPENYIGNRTLLKALAKQTLRKLHLRK